MTSLCRLRSALVATLAIPVGMIVIAGCASTTPTTHGDSRTSSPAAAVARATALYAPAPTPVLHPTATTGTAVPAAAGATAPPSSICPRPACVAGPRATLPDGHVVRLWSRPGAAGRTVVELVAAAAPVEWMVLPRGQGGAEQVRCASARSIAACVVVSRLGVHSAVGEMVLVVAGHIVDTGAFVIAQTSTISVTDYDHDGYPDVAARDSDYRPNFAEGHLVDHTYRYASASGRFVSTGCTASLADPIDGPAPVALQHGRCPTP